MTKWFAVVAGLLVAAFLFDAAVRARRRRLRASGLLPPEGHGTDADVSRLLRQGYRVEAVRLYRDIHGGGLRDAKEAVDALTANPGTGDGPSHGESLAHRLEAVGADDEVERLVCEGRKVEAVKRYREMRGVGLPEAKQAVDVVEQALRRAGRIPRS